MSRRDFRHRHSSVDESPRRSFPAKNQGICELQIGSQQAPAIIFFDFPDKEGEHMDESILRKTG